MNSLRPTPANPLVDPLIAHLSSRTDLPPAQIQRLVEDVIAYFNETVEGFASRRHAELQAEGLRNKTIFEQLREEIEQHRFATTGLSARQIRRLIYG